ncbi:electron transport complex subunit RsxG [Paraglaciecola aestuariivivens]
MTDSIQRTMAKNGLILAAFAIFTTALIALTFFGTKDQIALQQQQKLLKVLHAVLDKNSYDNVIQQDCVWVTSPELLGTTEPHAVYRATKDGQAVAVAIETTAMEGYSGKINLVVGITDGPSNSAKITGVRILEHKETPGLGDKIELRVSDWVLDFNQQLYEPTQTATWSVKKDGGKFDQFTGATITPRAVVKAVKLAADYYLANKNQIFNSQQHCPNITATASVSHE